MRNLLEQLADGSPSDRNFQRVTAEFEFPPTTFTPAWTGSGSNPAIGNGTLQGFFYRLGNIIIATWNVIPGSTTTFGTGIYGLSLPVTAKSSQRWTLGVYLVDAGTQSYVGMAAVNGGTTFETIEVGSNATGPTAWQATVPFTLTNGDRITISGVYPAA